MDGKRERGGKREKEGGREIEEEEMVVFLQFGFVAMYLRALKHFRCNANSANPPSTFVLNKS